MDTKLSGSASLHPILWIAGTAVTLLAIVGIASLTGMLPSHAVAPTESATAVVAAPPAALSQLPATAPVAPQAVAAVAAQPAPPHKTTKKKPDAHNAPAAVAAVPPPYGAGVPPDYAPPPAAVAAVPAALPCHACGVISAIRQFTREGEGTGLGAVGGGLIGGVLGNNVGRGDGRTLATLAGLVGGSLLGNKLEKNQRQSVGYRISVRMEDGTDQEIESTALPSWRVGDHVKVVNGAIVAR